MYINKMDRSDASLEFCLQSLKSRFTEEFLVLQIPIKGYVHPLYDLVHNNERGSNKIIY